MKIWDILTRGGFKRNSTPSVNQSGAPAPSAGKTSPAAPVPASLAVGGVDQAQPSPTTKPQTVIPTGTKEDAGLVSAAADRNLPEVIRFVEDRGVDINSKVSSSGCTALHAAAIHNLRDVAEYLLSKGASLEQRANNGRTPLVEALVWQSWHVAAMLIGSGADVNVEAPCGAPLLVAILHDCPAPLVKCLLEKGAKVDERVLDVAEAKHQYGTLPSEVFQALKRETAAAAHSVANTPSPSPAPTIAAPSKAGDVAEPLHVGSPKQVTVAELCEAARQGNLAEISGMLDREPAMVNASDSLGQTALHCAAGAGHKTVVELLIARGADVNAADSHLRRTPLHLASANNHKEVVATLLSNGADIHATCNEGGLRTCSTTPLHMAIARGQTDAAEVLINMGADVNREFGPQFNWMRPLHFAAAMGNERLVGLLLDRGADLTAADLDGRTALQLASMKGHVGVARLLRERGALR